MYRYIATYKDENGNEEILFLDAAFLVDAKARAENFGNMMGWTYISIKSDVV